jgi:hypothetical protein
MKIILKQSTREMVDGLGHAGPAERDSTMVRAGTAKHV